LSIITSIKPYEDRRVSLFVEGWNVATSGVASQDQIIYQYQARLRLLFNFFHPVDQVIKKINQHVESPYTLFWLKDSKMAAVASISTRASHLTRNCKSLVLHLMITFTIYYPRPKIKIFSGTFPSCWSRGASSAISFLLEQRGLFCHPHKKVLT
jgi:hypothetical protein